MSALVKLLATRKLMGANHTACSQVSANILGLFNLCPITFLHNMKQTFTKWQAFQVVQLFLRDEAQASSCSI